MGPSPDPGQEFDEEVRGVDGDGSEHDSPGLPGDSLLRLLVT